MLLPSSTEAPAKPTTALPAVVAAPERPRQQDEAPAPELKTVDIEKPDRVLTVARELHAAIVGVDIPRLTECDKNVLINNDSAEIIRIMREHKDILPEVNKVLLECFDYELEVAFTVMRQSHSRDARRLWSEALVSHERIHNPKVKVSQIFGYRNQFENLGRAISVAQHACEFVEIALAPRKQHAWIFRYNQIMGQREYGHTSIESKEIAETVAAVKKSLSTLEALMIEVAKNRLEVINPNHYAAMPRMLKSAAAIMQASLENDLTIRKLYPRLNNEPLVLRLGIDLMLGNPLVFGVKISLTAGDLYRSAKIMEDGIVAARKAQL